MREPLIHLRREGRALCVNRRGMLTDPDPRNVSCTRCRKMIDGILNPVREASADTK